jgi:pimeloyl-ACP methyl ester carboxylesterase
MPIDARSVVDAWARRGRRLIAQGTGSVVWEEGTGAPVVCLHGVPSSAFLYRKVLPELAGRGHRGIAVDLPGLGLADRPIDFDYRWSGLATWVLAALDELGLDRYHLVVHDIGGPIGFEVARLAPARVLSMTVLNTMTRVASFRPPWVMRPFRAPLLGEAYLAMLQPFVMERLMRLQGVSGPVPSAELRAYALLLKRGDGGRAFLRIMRSFELNTTFERRILEHLRERTYPAIVAWGEHDPALRLSTTGEDVRRDVGVGSIHRLPGRHFVQEDAAVEIADLVVDLASTAGS